MVPIRLKKLIAKKEISSLIQEMIGVVETPICIEDGDGQLLLGETGTTSYHNYPIVLSGKEIGWVRGNEKASFIASTLSYFAKTELERKSLANETLEKYKEINLLYKISGQLSACLNLQDVGRLVLEEASRLIEATSGSLMLLNESNGLFEIIAAFGPESERKAPIGKGKGVAGDVALTTTAEVINDVWSDSRFIPGEHPIKALICAPLKIQERVLGVMNISNSQPIQYTAGELKLVTTLASQAAAAIDNVRLHEYKLKEERIKSNLERYMAPQLVEVIINERGDINLKTGKKEVVMLFSDIRNFTAKCEELDAEKIVEYLNEYFTHMVDAIFQHEGTVNKFVGDMIFSIFGAPATLICSKKKAIDAAIAMQQRLNKIPVSWIRENFLTGIGISAGEVVVGNIGSPQHVDYTAIGDNVNIGSRLQSIASGGQILVCNRVYEATKHQFKFKEIGKVKVKGKKHEIEVYEVLY